MCFRKHGRHWITAYGWIEKDGKKHVWVAERKRCWAGPWALGCAWCANAIRHCAEDGIKLPHIQRRASANAGTSFPRFEARERFQAKSLFQHLRCNLHIAAWVQEQAWLQATA